MMPATPARRWIATAASAALVAAGVLAARPAVAAPKAPTPATHPAGRPDAEISKDLKQVLADLSKENTAETLQDPAKRAAAAPKVIPLLKRQSALYREIADNRHSPNSFVVIQNQLDGELYLYGDPETVAKVDANAKSTDAETSLSAQTVKLQSRWVAVGRDDAARKPILDEVLKLDGEHPASETLARYTAIVANASNETADRKELLGALAKMTSPLAKQITEATAAQEKARAESAAKLAAVNDKPLTLTGVTVEGKPFTSAEYKGKVVLVDFWATWCPPCRAELPHVKEVYEKYHAKGLEIVGVSNDYSADALKKYTAENKMPWVELFNAEAAAAHHWNPTTLGYGVNGIPTMFLIDKKGVCRTVEARSDMEKVIPQLLAE